MDDLDLGGFIERGGEVVQRGRGFRRFLRGDKRFELAFEGVEARLDGLVVRLTTEAGAGLFGGGSCIWHKCS